MFTAFNQLRCAAILHRRGARWVFIYHVIYHCIHYIRYIPLHTLCAANAPCPGRSVVVSRGSLWSVVLKSNQAPTAAKATRASALCTCGIVCVRSIAERDIFITHVLHTSIGHIFDQHNLRKKFLLKTPFGTVILV